MKKYENLENREYSSMFVLRQWNTFSNIFFWKRAYLHFKLQRRLIVIRVRAWIKMIHFFLLIHSTNLNSDRLFFSWSTTIKCSNPEGNMASHDFVASIYNPKTLNGKVGKVFFDNISVKWTKDGTLGCGRKCYSSTRKLIWMVLMAYKIRMTSRFYSRCSPYSDGDSIITAELQVIQGYQATAD